jgi:hypothetical protein
MSSNNSPMESLAAVSITFLAGILSAAGVSAYVSQVRKSAAREHSSKTGHIFEPTDALTDVRAPANDISLPSM